MYENEQTVRRTRRNTSSARKAPTTRGVKKPSNGVNINIFNDSKKLINIVIAVLLIVAIGFGVKTIFFQNGKAKANSVASSFLREYKKSDESAFMAFGKTELEKRVDKIENRLMEYKVLETTQSGSGNDQFVVKVEVSNVDKNEVIKKTRQSLNDEKIDPSNDKYNDEYMKRYKKYQDELKNSKQTKTYSLVVKKSGKNGWYIQNATEVK